MTSMRLKRMGSKGRPYYRIVVMDSRAARKSAVIAEVGQYHPVEAEGKQYKLNTEAINDWLAKGAQPSDTVKSILNKNGVTVTRTVQK